MKRKYTTALLSIFTLIALCIAVTWVGAAVEDDPNVRMPGTQPNQGVNLEAPNRCLNCHAGYNQAVEPGYNWKGSMMAQSARDPIFWACMTVAAQDSTWVLGNPNATDICERCHFPEGWLGGRSDPTNASAMTGSDYDGIHCDFCHRMWDPFFESTFDGLREGGDWSGYWDEAATSNLSQTEAQNTYLEDTLLSGSIKTFHDGSFFSNNQPEYSTYSENASGQYFVSTNSQKRASFADANAKHKMLYSRTHKSKYFCGTCHDVSNPALANLGMSDLLDQSGGSALITEQYSASRYFHVERTFSEFMLSAYGQQGGASTNPEFQDQGAPNIANAAKCQDCHMRDVSGVACNKNGTVLRPDGSTEHPNSGVPLHDMTGGNAWISYILATLDSSIPEYDPVNVDLLERGPAALTLDLSYGQTPRVNGTALLAGSDRAKQQLRLAATIKNLSYNGGNLSFRLQNNTGHKLISGFPEGRRMFVNIKAKDGSGNVIYEVNPYDYTAGTLKGLNPSAPLDPNNEAYVNELIYEVHPSSNADVPNTNGNGLTGEEETFHFVLATGRYKDNRIPPRGFDSVNASSRHAEPVWEGSSDTGYFSIDEYAGGYDEIALSDYSQVNFPSNAASVDVTLYYQGTSREYIEFLRDEINGDQNLTLPDPGAYIVQSDPFFAQLREWGDVIWQLWEHNHAMGVDGIVPFAMAEASLQLGCVAPIPTLLSATPGNSQVTLEWETIVDDPSVLGYRIYYDQAGKAQLVGEVLGPGIGSYTDTGLTDGQEYCYKVTTLYDCDGDAAFDLESGFSNILCATPTNPGQVVYAGVSSINTGVWVTSGKGKNQITNFVSTDTFNQGDAVVIQAYVVDGDGIPLSNATVEITILDSGSSTVTTLITGPSDSNGMAETSWQTQSPNKRGVGGTPVDNYTATTAGVTASGYAWDGIATNAPIIIQ